MKKLILLLAILFVIINKVIGQDLRNYSSDGVSYETQKKIISDVVQADPIISSQYLEERKKNLAPDDTPITFAEYISMHTKNTSETYNEIVNDLNFQENLGVAGLEATVAATNGAIPDVGVNGALEASLVLSKEWSKNLMISGFAQDKLNAKNDLLESLELAYAINADRLKGLPNEEKSSILVKELVDVTDKENLAPEGEVRDWQEGKIQKDIITVLEAHEDRFTDIEKGLVAIDTDLQNFKNVTNKNFENLNRRMVEGFAEMNESIAILAVNQEQINKELQEVKERVKKNTQKIEQNENNIKTNSSNIVENRKLISDNRKLIGVNRQDIDILNGYMYGNLDVNAKIEALKKKQLGTADYTEPERKGMIAKLELIKASETLTTVASYAAQAGNLAKKLEWLKPETKAGKIVSDVLDLSVSGLQISANILNAVGSGNPLGYVDAAFQIMGLFGGKSQKSPELQYLEVINQKLDVIDNKLNHALEILKVNHEILIGIDEKMNALLEAAQIINENTIELRKETYEYYKSTMNSLEFISKELERINFKSDILINATRAIYLQDYNECPALLRNLPANSFSDYLEIYNSTGRSRCNSCLKGIQRIPSGRDDFAFLMSTYIKPEYKEKHNTGIAETEIRDVYEPAYSLFFDLYPHNQKEAYIALLNPVVRRDVESTLLLNISNNFESFDNSFNPKDSLSVGKYLNYEAVLEISNRYLDVFTFFELEFKPDFEPMTLEEYMIYSKDIKVERNEVLTNDLVFLLQKINLSIAQQSLISGQTLSNGVYNRLFFSNYTQQQKQKAIDVLKSNVYVQSTFLKKLVYNITDNNADAIAALEEIYAEVISKGYIDKEDALKLNSRINRLNLPVFFQSVSTKDEKSFQLKLRIFMKKVIFDGEKVITDENEVYFDIPIKDFYSLFNQDILIPNSIPRLLETKNKLEAKIKDLIFMKKVANADSQSNKLTSEHFNSILMSGALNFKLFNN